jgi:hypothetical protein
MFNGIASIDVREFFEVSVVPRLTDLPMDLHTDQGVEVTIIRNQFKCHNFSPF